MSDLYRSRYFGDFLLYFDENNKRKKIYFDAPGAALSLSNYKLPKELEGVPVIKNKEGDHFVLLAHLFTRILICKCSKSSFHNTFNTSKMKCYQMKVVSSSLYGWWNSTEYAKMYPVSFLRTNAKAIKVQGLEKWVNEGRMKKFIDRQNKKCSDRGCFS